MARCVLLQCIIHKNLHFKNSITRCFRQLDNGTCSSKRVTLESYHSEWTLRPVAVHHPQEPALQEFNHSLFSAA
jgi:hypothetical protein